MKASAYNYYIEKEGKVLFYNGLTDSHFFVSKSYAEKYHCILSSPDNYSELYPDFILVDDKKLNFVGYIVDF